jgi:hypothetical protein
MRAAHQQEKPMSSKRVLIGAVLAAAIALTTLTGAAAQTVIAFTTAQVGTSGVTGSGSIAPLGNGDESALNAQWQGLAPGSVHMASQYHGTSCGNYDAVPEFVFTTVTADSQGKAAGLITVKKPFKNWPNRPHFLILHATSDPASAAIACGTIVAVAVAAPTTAATVAPPTSAPATAQVSPAAPSAGDSRGVERESGNGGTLAMVGLLVAGLAIGGTLAGRRLIQRR